MTVVAVGTSVGGIDVAVGSKVGSAVQVGRAVGGTAVQNTGCLGVNVVV